MPESLDVKMNKSKLEKPEMDRSKGSKKDMCLAHVHSSSNEINHCLNRSPKCSLNTHIHLHFIPFLEVTTPEKQNT